MKCKCVLAFKRHLTCHNLWLRQRLRGLFKKKTHQKKGSHRLKRDVHDILMFWLVYTRFYIRSFPAETHPGHHTRHTGQPWAGMTRPPVYWFSLIRPLLVNSGYHKLPTRYNILEMLQSSLPTVTIWPLSKSSRSFCCLFFSFKNSCCLSDSSWSWKILVVRQWKRL